MLSRTRYWLLVCPMSVAAVTVAHGGGWVDFSNETANRMPTSLNDPATSTSDTEEKDYAWGDIDQDGDIDLVVVRKQPFTSTGRRTNVLFMNEGLAEGHALNGVFVDRTTEYATLSDVEGDNGFATPTNDRDVVLVDVDLDGWLDLVTATTLTDNAPKHLSHPRVYMNLGEIDGVWQGFRHEDSRIPQMHATAGPRFCSVAAGDVTGDGSPDLYFGDYDSGGTQLFDYNNKLLVNDGNGFFSDESGARLTSQMLLSAFGAASVVADMNNDGVNDVVKQTSLSSPTHVAVTYNDPANEGVFNGYDTVYDNAPYFVSVGDLNNDGRLDIVVVDDGTDRYMINTGNGGDGQANFTTLTFPSGPSSGFGGNSFIADLNNDGFNDVLITDVDVDISGCSRRMHIYRNLGNLPNPSFQEQGQIIPDSMLNGTHDVGVFDINQDGWLDLVVGRCGGTQIWMNIAPEGLVFSYPSGVPGSVLPDTATTFPVVVSGFGGAVPAPGSARLHVAVGDQPFAATTMRELGEDMYEANLPGVPCTERIAFYLSAETDGGGLFFDPPDAPSAAFTVTAALGTEIVFRDLMEADVSGWTVTEVALASGGWEQADPNGTIAGGGELAAPEDDATAGADNVKAFVTENGPPGGTAGGNDVDGGPAYLMSPRIDLAGSDATISYARWFFCDDAGSDAADFFYVDVSSDDGATWVSVADQTSAGTEGAWETVAFNVSDHVEPTANVRVRFWTEDQPNDSVTEAGVDNFQVEIVQCGAACTADIDDDGMVAFGDLLSVLSAWGPCDVCREDIDLNGAVDFGDLLAVLSAWGPCE